MSQNSIDQLTEKTPTNERGIETPIFDIHDITSGLEEASKKRMGIENTESEIKVSKKTNTTIPVQSVEAQEERLRKQTTKKPKPIEKRAAEMKSKETLIKNNPISIETKIDKDFDQEVLDPEQIEMSERAKKIGIGTMEKVITKAYLEKDPEIKAFDEVLNDNINQELESKKEEGKLREEVQKIFNERIDEIYLKISSARVLYGKQIKIKTQHEHTQTRIGILKSKLFRPFTRKPNINNEEYEKAKNLYEESVNELKNCLSEESLDEKVLKKAFEIGDKGLEIVNEEKMKVKEVLRNKILLEEKTLIITLRIESLPKKDSDIINKFATLRKKMRRDDEEYFSDIISHDEYEHA